MTMSINITTANYDGNHTDVHDVMRITSSSNHILMIAWNCFCLILVALAIFGNLMIVLISLYSKQLRKIKCTPLVVNLAIADLICSVYLNILIILYMQGYHYRYQHINKVMTVDGCFYISWWAIVTVNVSSSTTFLLGVDRLLAILKPIYYRRLGKTYVCWPIAASWLFGLVNVVLAYLSKNDIQLAVLPTCNVIVVLNGHAQQFYFATNTALIVLVLVVFASIIVYTKRKQTRGKRLSLNNVASTRRIHCANARHIDGGQATLEDHRQHHRLVRSASQSTAKISSHLLTSFVVSTMIYVFGYVVAVVVAAAMTYLSDDDPQMFHKTSHYLIVLVLVDVMSNFYVYCARCAVYRRTMRSMVLAN